MACALRQNDLRSWQNDLRLISDTTDVLGKMTCALTCALACALTCAMPAGVCVAQRKSFSTPKEYKLWSSTTARRVPSQRNWSPPEFHAKTSCWHFIQPTFVNMRALPCT